LKLILVETVSVKLELVVVVTDAEEEDAVKLEESSIVAVALCLLDLARR